MQTVISSLCPFPPIPWWSRVITAGELYFDLQERFQKMSARNRYRILGANGLVLMSVPLEGGRDVRLPMESVKISYDQPWMSQHWKTLTSAYRRAAYFEHYEPELARIFSQPVEGLAAFNRITFDWAAGALGWKGKITYAEAYHAEYPGTPDLRGFPLQSKEPAKPYFQLFADRHGFQPGLSILDLLMAEGPYAGRFL